MYDIFTYIYPFTIEINQMYGDIAYMDGMGIVEKTFELVKHEPPPIHGLDGRDLHWCVGQQIDANTSEIQLCRCRKNIGQWSDFL